MKQRLMVTPYAPYRDGIAAYAVQEVRQLRAAGEPVEVLSPLPSAAHHHLSLGGVRGMAALVKRARSYESVTIQFSPEMIFGACRTPAQRVAVWGLLGVLARATKLEIRLHEIEYGPLARNPAEKAAAKRVLASVDTLSVHTDREVDELVERLDLDRRAVTLLDHGSAFAVATDLTREQARAELGLDGSEHVFLCIGFLQEHKGFDVAVEAFAQSGLAGAASLHIVGSVRVDHPDLLAYARRLHGLCRSAPGAELHERYVSDEEFDRWIVAADTVVLPYREIWSSGVLERAKLFDRQIVVTDVGGMGDQAPEGTLFFTDPASLVKAMRRCVGGAAEAGLSEGETEAESKTPFDLASVDRTAIEAQIRSRVRKQHLASDTAGPAVDPLLALGPLHRPHAISARPGVTQVKRVLRRLVNWELDPIATRVEELQQATIDAVVELESRVAGAPTHRDATDRDRP
ncbi:MAG: glycosyltransferase family 4 protein [Acidimicrobiales bacterium]